MGLRKCSSRRVKSFPFWFTEQSSFNLASEVYDVMIIYVLVYYYQLRSPSSPQLPLSVFLPFRHFFFFCHISTVVQGLSSHLHTVNEKQLARDGWVQGVQLQLRSTTQCLDKINGASRKTVFSQDKRGRTYENTAVVWEET